VVTYLLEISGDGTKLSGWSSGYNPSSESITSFSFSAHRNQERASRDREKYVSLSSERLKELINKQMVAFPLEPQNEDDPGDGQLDPEANDANNQRQPDA
jgi:hypothetical protein